MSENAGPVAAVYPASIPSGTFGKPIIIPTSRKIRAVANPGNQPECIADIPTINSDAIAENAANITQIINFGTDISAYMPDTTARPIATTT